MSPDERDEVRRATTASAPARSCSTSSRRASSRASRRTRTTGAASRPSTRSCCGSSTTRTRWSPRSRPASSTPPGTSRRALQRSSRRTTASSRSRATRARSREIAINGGDGLKKPHPALRGSRGAQGDRATRSTGRRSSTRVLERARRSRSRRSARPPNPKWTPELSAGPDPRLRPRPGERDPRRGRLRGHGRRRRARDAGRRPAAQLHATTLRSDGVTARRSPSSSPAGWTRSASPRREKIATTASSPTIIGKGDYDMFFWGWTPVRRPRHDARRT